MMYLLFFCIDECPKRSCVYWVQKVQSPVLMVAELYYCHVGAAHNGHEF